MMSCFLASKVGDVCWCLVYRGVFWCWTIYNSVLVGIVCNGVDMCLHVVFVYMHIYWCVAVFRVVGLLWSIYRSVLEGDIYNWCVGTGVLYRIVVMMYYVAGWLYRF